MAIDKALLDQLLAEREPQDLFAKGGLIDDLKKALSERMLKLLYLVLNRAVEAWKRPPREWCEAKAQFAILFGDRFVV